MLIEFLSRLSRREKIISYSAVIFVSMAVLDRAIFRPILSKMESLNRAIKEREAAINKDLHILAQKDRIEKESKLYASFSLKPLSQEEEIASLLKDIESLASQSSVYLFYINPGEIREEGILKKYTVELGCEAQLEQIVDFIYNIEVSNKLLRIVRYNIRSKEEGSSIARCRMNISKIVLR